jgi:hypothetical protein
MLEMQGKQWMLRITGITGDRKKNAMSSKHTQVPTTTLMVGESSSQAKKENHSIRNISYPPLKKVKLEVQSKEDDDDLVEDKASKDVIS